MALAEAVGRKEAADAIVATKERRATELSIEIFNLEERSVAVKDELETRSRERLLAKMTKRRSDLEALRETARKGEATMAAVERANESSLLTRMQTRKKDLASRDEKEAAVAQADAAVVPLLVAPERVPTGTAVALPAPVGAEAVSSSSGERVVAESNV